MRKTFLLLALLASAACGSDSPAGPGSNIAGNWSGTATGTAEGVTRSGTLSVTLIGSGGSLTGTWATTYAADPSVDNSGSVEGSISDGQLDMTLTPSNPQTCPYHAVGTVSGSAMTGSYAAFNCTVAASGTFAISKQ